ncbi:MAG: pyridoxamine 5'-phosphate oxidase [Candidatus Baltobacteraceae bacterium]
MDEIDLAHMRRSYERAELHEASVLSDPFAQTARWLKDARESGLPEPNAMCLATAGAGQPSARMVLLRGLDARGLVFYTGYGSRKGTELQSNPLAAALFYWAPLERQIRVEGRVEQVPEQESDAYFASRPRDHQLGAWASEQSEPVESRDLLEQRMRDYGERFEGEAVARPHSWGGFLIRPHRFEFWQGRPSRMHDRLEFNLESGRWNVGRLQP